MVPDYKIGIGQVLSLTLADFSVRHRHTGFNGLVPVSTKLHREIVRPCLKSAGSKLPGA